MGVRYPADYASAFQRVVFELSGVELDAEGCVAVDILQNYNSEATGEKFYYGQNSVEVDVSAYARAALNVEPATWSGLRMDRARSVLMSVRVAGEQSEKVVVCAATQPLPINALLSQLTKRTIALDECDEIAFVTDEREVTPTITVITQTGIIMELGGEMFLSEKGVVVFGLKVAEVVVEVQSRGVEPEDIVQIIVSVKMGAEERIRVTYEVAQCTRGVRMAWVNRWGAIDYYTFPNVVVSRVVAHSQAVAEEPCLTYTECEISSDIVPESIAEALSEIVASPKVWLVSGDVYTPCQVATESVEWSNNSAPSTVKLVVRTQNTPQSNE
jgi:hypothetical protein